MCKLAWSSWREAAAGRKAHTCCNTSAGSEHRVREWSCGGAALTASLVHSVGWFLDGGSQLNIFKGTLLVGCNCCADCCGSLDVAKE
jgi:hypothetical protein